MPMIVDPSAPLVEPPDRVTSPDGRLAAIVDEVWAGVILAVDCRLMVTPIVNEVLNPSMEMSTADTAPYDPGSVGVTRSRTSGSGWAGSYRQVVNPGTVSLATSGIEYTLGRSIASGETVTVTCHTRTPYTAELHARLRNSSTGEEVVVPVPQTSVSSTWTPFEATATGAPGKTYDRVVISLTGAGGAWAVDGVMLQTGAAATGYVDGDQPECEWIGTPHDSPSRRIRDAAAAADIRRVRIMRTDPGGGGPVPVRSADPAWAIGGSGTAYDHEAPLGVAVIYTATPVYANGSTGPSTALAVTVPAPVPGESQDVWLKSVNQPSLSLRAVIVGRQEATAAGRQEVAEVPGSPFRVVAYDEHAAESYTLTVDVPPEAVEQVRLLLRSGVLLLQTRPEYVTLPDAYHVPADITGPISTGRLGSSGGYQFTWAVEPVARPDTAGSPMRIPGWSWDQVADQFAIWDAVAASYSSWASLSTNGVT